MIKKAATAGTMNKAEAAALTERIRKAVDGLWSLLLDAHRRKAWQALGYGSWKAYVEQELGMTKQRSYQLLDQGRVIESIREATGEKSTTVDLSEREARDVKDDLPAVTAEIKTRVEQGEKPEKATAEVIAAQRAEKEKAKAEKAAQQAEHDRQRDEHRAALPDSIKRAEAAKDEAKAAAKAKPFDDVRLAALHAELEELREANVSLTAENAALKAENKLLGDMQAEWRKGGFAEVIAGKDEVIRVQASRIESESREKVKNLNSMEWWKKQAIALGWSSREVIDLETGEIVHHA